MDILKKLFGKRNEPTVRVGKLRIVGETAVQTELEFQEVTRPQAVAAGINTIDVLASTHNDETWFLVFPPHGILHGQPTYWMYAESRGVFWRSSYAITRDEFAAITKIRGYVYIE